MACLFMHVTYVLRISQHAWGCEVTTILHENMIWSIVLVELLLYLLSHDIVV